MAIYYVDGEYVDASAASLPLSDMAILRGYGVFDFLRTYNGKPFHLNEHLVRLRNSAALLYIDCPWSVSQLSDIVAELLRRNEYSEANIRLLITGGDSEDSITPLARPRLIVMVTELKTFPATWYSDGVKVITSEITRHVPGSKSTNYIQAIIALRKAREDGAVESLYVNEKNQLLEGTTSNLFVVRDGRIITPEEGILPGVTREVVMRIAGAEFTVERSAVSRNDLHLFSEAFLTSSNKEVAPIVQIDDHVLSDGPGPVTRRIMELFHLYTAAW